MPRDYADDVERIKNKYEKRIKRFLNEIAKELRKDGWKVSRPVEVFDEQFEWWMLASRRGLKVPREDDIDIRFVIAESAAYEGTEDGINFMIDTSTVGGEIIGGLAPYNYTPEVWVPVDDPEAVEERFELVEDIDPADMVNLLADY